MAINVTIFHDPSGNIQSVVKDPPPSTPPGLTALSKTITKFNELYNKRIKTSDNSVIDRDFISLTGTGTNVIGTDNVGKLIFKKINGETLLDMTSASDNDKIEADLRSEDNDISELGFLRCSSKDMVNGAVTFELAAPSATSSENIVLYNPKLKLHRTSVSYEV